jgi:serine/threonine-protein kinase RsbW
MKEVVSLAMPARLENLHALVDAAKEAAEKRGLSPDRIFKLELALEEALVNIINYAYGDSEGEITVACGSDDRGFFVTKISDRGRPFDMTSVPPPDLGADVGGRKIGGLGIHMMKTLLDDLAYRREGEKNVLELRISLASTDL